jgi:hypothetical protein
MQTKNADYVLVQVGLSAEDVLWFGLTIDSLGILGSSSALLNALTKMSLPLLAPPLAVASDHVLIEHTRG